jgi:hypothetical protein
MIGLPSRKQNLQRKKSSGAVRLRSHDRRTIALRATVVGGKRHPYDYQVVWLAHFCI